jgi:hypothetical protein
MLRELITSLLFFVWLTLVGVALTFGVVWLGDWIGPMGMLLLHFTVICPLTFYLLKKVDQHQKQE